MKNFEKLTGREKDLLLKFPAYITLLAANHDNGMDETEKKEAIHLSHIKTYSSDPLLREFYKEADKVFEKNILQLNSELPKEKSARSLQIKMELSELENILSRMEKSFASSLRQSMASFKDHVSKAHNNALEYFMFPIPIKGITE